MGNHHIQIMMDQQQNIYYLHIHNILINCNYSYNHLMIVNFNNYVILD